MAEGHCNCKSIRVLIPALPDQSTICYCTNCKRAGSGPGSIVYVLNTSEVDIRDPNNILKSYHDANTKSGNPITRQFCGNCGSPVASLLGPDAPKIILKGGLFDHIPPPNFESFDCDRPGWLKILKADEEGKMSRE